MHRNLFQHRSQPRLERSSHLAPARQRLDGPSRISAAHVRVSPRQKITKVQHSRHGRLSRPRTHIVLLHHEPRRRRLRRCSRRTRHTTHWSAHRLHRPHRRLRSRHPLALLILIDGVRQVPRRCALPEHLTRESVRAIPLIRAGKTISLLRREDVVASLQERLTHRVQVILPQQRRHGGRVRGVRSKDAGQRWHHSGQRQHLTLPMVIFRFREQRPVLQLREGSAAHPARRDVIHSVSRTNLIASRA